MTYNGKELAALVKMGMAMAQADGHVDEIEKFAIASELQCFGVQGTDLKNVIIGADIMEAGDAFDTVRAFSAEQKKYACGYLAAVMAADGRIDPAELKLWKLISTLGNFPTMNIEEALHFWKNH